MESGTGSASANTSTCASAVAIIGPSMSAPTSALAAVALSEPTVAPRTEGEGDRDVVITGKNEPPEKKQKKSTSGVWEHYTKECITKTESDGVVKKELWATCKKCTYKSRAESTRGTKAFWNHLANKHAIKQGQQLLKLEKGEHNNTASVQTYRYDQAESMKKFYLSLVMHEYPFNMVEHEYFVDFIKSLRPSFSFKSHITTRKEIVDLFIEKRQKLYEHFKSISSRFSTTMDMWTSNQNKGYMCIMVHWIDDNWQMQKRIVTFMHVKGHHSGTVLGNEFVMCMMKMNLEKKLFAMTLDNASANDKCVTEVVSTLKKRAPLICDGALFHVRCFCHILNLVAQDGLKVIARSIHNIRATIVIVKNSPLQWEEFKKCALECDLDIKRGLSLDVSTRWNSTFQMLKQAVYYRRAFDRLLFLNARKYEKCAPSDADWDMALELCKCLKTFHEATEIFSASTYPTANLFFQKFCAIKLAITKWCCSSNEVISEMAKVMKVKYDKYWEKSNIALAIACFLDPRYKKKLVEYYLKKIYGEVVGMVELNAFTDVIRQLFEAYIPTTKETTTVPRVVSQPHGDDLGDIDMDDHDLEEYLYDTTVPTHGEKSESDVYMKEPPVRWVKTDDNDKEFDILSWWRTQQGIFPILSRLARDALAIQVSTVASESAFSGGGRIVDPFRSRLDPDVVEALICTKDWTIASRRDSKVKVASLIDEFMEMDYEDVQPCLDVDTNMAEDQDSG